MDLLPADFSPWLAAGLVAVSFLSSLLTVTAGLGGGTIMIAVMASVMPAPAVIPTHGVIQLGSNAGRAAVLRQFVNRPVLAWFTVGALVGAVAGGSVMVVLPPAVIKLVIGAFILWSVWGPKFSRRRISDPAFAPVGVGTTFLTMFVGGTGPFVAAFVSPERFGKEPTVATHAACMTVQHGLKVAVFGFFGFAFGPWIPLLIAMVVGGFLGTLVGRMVLLRLPERAFLVAFKTVLTLLALRLLWSAATTWTS